MKFLKVFLKVSLFLLAAPVAATGVHAQGSAANIASPSITSLTSGGFIYDCRAADLNLNGRIDLVLAIQGGALKVFNQLSDGSFSGSPDYSLSSGGSGSHAVAVGDMNGDSIPDLVHLTNVYVGGTTNAYAPMLHVYIGDIGPGATPYSTVVGTTMTGIAPCPADYCGIALADLDHDGLLDAVFNGGELGVAIGDGSGGFSSWHKVSGVSQTVFPAQVVLTDFNGDGDVDIVSGEWKLPEGYAYVCLGDGAGNFTKQTPVLATSLVAGLAGADIDMDGDTDVISALADGSADVFKNDSGTLQAPVNYKLSPPEGPMTEGHSVDVGDFNEDGTPDFAISGKTDTDGVIIELVNDGHGAFGNQNTTTLTGTGHPTRVYVKIGQKDTNIDSHPDLLFTSSGWQGPPPFPSFGFALNATSTPNPWADRGNSLTATTTPHLVGAGWVEANYPWTLTLTNALPGAAVWMFASHAEAPPPPALAQNFKGGLVVPDWLEPNLLAIQLLGPADANGSKVVKVAPQSLLPPGWTFVFHFWCIDAAGPYGLSASNAIRVH